MQSMFAPKVYIETGSLFLLSYLVNSVGIAKKKKKN